ncbi:MAG TPA: S41 family peptidase, partial [Gemmatimonadales bacterium]|nr:S41 family peptidase [Gemmatimonadales bacterium]
ELERGPRLEPERFVVALKYDRLEPRAVGDVRKLDSITGYVAFHQFTVDAHEQLRAAFRRLLREQHARQVVLDLRRNPGGDLAAAVRVAAAFFPERTLVFRSEGRRPATDREFRTDRDGEFRDVPLVVLIDERTASAAEALAGSLQDHDRALVLGRRSFGKALIQQLLPVPPAGDAVWLTTARVVTPSGRVIQRSYRGLNAEQYFSQGGRAGAEADTLRVYRTAAGREVRGGGGIAPDVPLPAPPGIPVWLSVAADSGFDHAVADSVAATLPATPGARTAWLDASDEWRLRLVPPFLSRVRSRLGVAAAADSALERLIARHLAARVADVRWGPDARDELLVRSDPDVRAARTYFARLGTLLAGSAR